MNVTIPSKIRTIAYVVFASLGVAQGAIYAAYNAVHADPPAALVAASAAFASIVAAPFIVAVLNINKDDPALRVDFDPVDAPADDPEDEDVEEPSEPEVIVSEQYPEDN